MGCVSLHYARDIQPAPSLGVRQRGIYHSVRTGETLWRISRIYNMDLGELIKVNNISDVTNIEIGQQIFIPETYKISTGQRDRSLEDFIWPLKGKVVVRFREIYQNMVNKGINIQPSLDRKVVASRSGQVVFCHNDFKGFGKTLILEHADGFMTVYAGLQEVFIKVGDRVSRGAVIAKLGSTPGEKGTYLHFEIRKGHRPQNPVFYLPS